ncbi:MAG: hypothetical protein J7M26_03400, partial [Armatimonadetes bacterium]|nr:hypothetical protein [Armatimonadota bacterium]
MAGAPFSHLLVRDDDGRWQDLGADETSRRGTTYALYKRLGFLTKIAVLDQPAAAVAVNWPDHAVPTYWPLAGGDTCVFQAANGLSPRGLKPLVVSVSREGRPLGSPVLYGPLLRRFPRARLLAVGFRGASHPFNPRAWGHAEETLTACVRLLLAPDRPLIADVWPHEPLYWPGEKAQLTVRLISPRKATVARCRLRLFDPATGREVFSAQQRAQVTPAEPTDLGFFWTLPARPAWCYLAVADLAGAAGPFNYDVAEFVTYQPDFCSRAKPRSISREGRPVVGKRPAWFSGVNLYTADPRSVGMFFNSRNEPGHHPTVDFFDRDLSLLRILGGNTTRTHYFEFMLTPQALADQRNHAVRRLDAYNMLHAAHDVGAFYGPFTFTPGKYDLWQKYMTAKYGAAVAKADPYATPQWQTEEAAYYEALARRCRHLGATNIIWQLINEPERYPPRSERDPRKREQGAETVARWCRTMASALKKGGYNQAGVGHSTAPMSYGWDPRGALNFLTSFDVHHYGRGTVGSRASSNPLWSIPFGLAYGRPAVLGEYGLPNAGQSHDAFLGRWLASYEAALTCVLAEGSLGFLNFYLNCGMGHVDAPEWGMVRPDYTEKPAALAWKRWNWLAQRLRPDELLPFDGALLFDPTVRYGNPQFISQLGRLYLNLLREGLPTALLSPADLARLRETKRLPTVVFAPEEGRTAAVRAALAHLRGWSVQVTDSLDAFRDALRARLPVRELASGAQAFYVRRLRGGRWLVAVVENDGKPVVFRVADHAYELALPEGRSALLVVTRQGLPELIAACAPVKMDGRTVVDGPAEGYAVWAGHGRSLATEGATDLWAEDQQAVTASFSLPDDLRSRRWHLEADQSVPPDVLSLTRSLLVARGLKLDRSAPNT